MINYPMELRRKIRFCTPNRRVSALTVTPKQISTYNLTDLGHEDAPLRVDSNPIFRGSCATDSDLFVPPVEVIVELANCRADEDGVRRFTRKFGPLVVQPDGTFVFRLGDWRSMQARFRFAWNGFLGLDSRFPSTYVPLLKERAPHLFSEPLKGVLTQGRFELMSDGVSFVADSLYGALLLVLFAAHDRRLLRHCPKPDCENPYFIAAHPKQRYCTELCAEWAQAQAKSAWWKESGKRWLDQRSKAASSRSKPKRGRKNRGTKKTR